MNRNLPKRTSFNFRIERHRHDENKPYSIQFRVGGNGKRFSRGVGLASDVMPVLRSMRREQLESGTTKPLMSRAMADVERICREDGIAGAE